MIPTDRPVVPRTMRAVVCPRYGVAEEALELREVETPRAGEGEALVRVVASTVAGDDWHLVQGLPWVGRLATGLLRPKRWAPGLDLAGVVEVVGAGVTDVRPGDEVFGWGRGTHAEYVTVPAGQLAPKPPSVGFEEAAALPIAGFTALQAVRDSGDLRTGQAILVNGASGGVGTLAVQIAKALGGEVTGVCSARNRERVIALGATRVVDYAREDFTRLGVRWDVIVDLIGNRSLADCRRALAPRGTLVLVGGRGGRWFMGTDRWLRALALSPFVSQRLRPMIHEDRRADLLRLGELVAADAIRPVIDRRYPLSEVPRAIRYLEGRHARGKVVIEVGSPAPPSPGP